MPDSEPAAVQQALDDALKRIKELEATLSTTQQKAITQALAHQAELSAVRQELAQSTAVSNDLQSQVAALGSQITAAIDASTTAGVDANATITALRKENAAYAAYAANRVTMEAQIEALEAAGLNQGGQDLAAMAADRDEIEAERDNFHYQINGENGFLNTIQRLRDQIAQAEPQALQDRNALLESQIQAIEADLAALPTPVRWTAAQEQLAGCDDLRLELTDSQLLVESLERQLKDSKFDLAKANLALARSSEGQVQTEQPSSSQTLGVQNAELLLQIRTLEIHIAEQDTELANLRRAQMEEEQNIKSIQQAHQLELDGVKNDAATSRQSLEESLEESQEEKRRLDQHIKDLELETSDMEGNLAYIEEVMIELRDQKVDLDTSLLHANQEIEELREQLENGVLENGVQDELNEALEFNIALEEKIERLEAIIAEHNAGIGSEPAQPQRSSEGVAAVEELRTQISQLNARLAELSADNENLRGSLNAAQHGNNQQDEIAEHEKLVQQLRDHCAQEKEALRAEIERLQEALEKLNTDTTNENANLNARLEESLARVIELETQNSDCAHQNGLLDQQLLAARGSLQVSENALEEALSDLAHVHENDESAQENEQLLQAEVEHLQTALATATGELADLRTEQANLTNELQDLQAQLQLAKESLDNIATISKNPYDDCMEENEVLRRNLQAAQDRIRDLENKADAAIQKLLDLKKEVLGEGFEQSSEIPKYADLQNIIQSQKLQFDTIYAEREECNRALKQAQADLFACRQAHNDNQGVLKIWGDRLHAYEEADKERAKNHASEAANVDNEALEKLQADLFECRQAFADNQGVIKLWGDRIRAYEEADKKRAQNQTADTRLADDEEAAEKPAAYEQALNEMREELTACRQQHTDDQKTIQDLQTQLAEMEQQHEKQLVEAQNAKQTSATQLEKVKKVDNQIIDSMEADLNMAQDELAACRKQHEDDQAMIENLENQSGQHEGSDEDASNDEHLRALNKAQEDLAACRKQHAVDQNTILDLENQLAQMEDLEESHQEIQNEEHEQALKKAQEDLAACLQQHAEDSKKIRDLEHQLEQIRQNERSDEEPPNDGHDQTLNEAQKELATCREQLAERETTIQDLQAQIKMEESQDERRAVHDQALKEAQGDLAACREQHDNDQSTIKALNEEIGKLKENDFDELQFKYKDALTQWSEVQTLCDAKARSLERLEAELEVIMQDLANSQTLIRSLQAAATAEAGADLGEILDNLTAQATALMTQLNNSEDLRLELTTQLNEVKANPNATEQQQARRINELEALSVTLGTHISSLDQRINGLEQSNRRAEVEAEALRAQLPQQPTGTGSDEAPIPEPTPSQPRLILRSGRTYRRVALAPPTRRNTTAPRPLYTGLGSSTGGIKKRPSSKKGKKDKK